MKIKSKVLMEISQKECEDKLNTFWANTDISEIISINHTTTMSFTLLYTVIITYIEQ